MELIVLILFIVIIGQISKSSSSSDNHDATNLAGSETTSDDNNYPRHETHDSSSFDINPANGNMMIGGIGGVDTFGNPYGTDEH